MSTQDYQETRSDGGLTLSPAAQPVSDYLKAMRSVENCTRPFLLIYKSMPTIVFPQEYFYTYFHLKKSFFKKWKYKCISVSKSRVLSSANSCKKPVTTGKFAIHFDTQGAIIMHGLVILHLNRKEWQKVVWGPQITFFVQSWIRKKSALLATIKKH